MLALCKWTTTQLDDCALERFGMHSSFTIGIDYVIGVGRSTTPVPGQVTHRAID